MTTKKKAVPVKNLRKKKPVKKSGAQTLGRILKKYEARCERMIDYTFKVTVSVDPHGVSGVRINKSQIHGMLCAALEQYKDLSCGPVAATDPTSEAFERIARGSEFSVK